MRFAIKHLLETDVDTFWHKIFFDDAFNRALCVDHLKFRIFKTLDFKQEPNGVITRRVENGPPAEVPKVVAKALGDSVNYVEEGRFDPASRKWSFSVIPAVAANKIRTVGELWVEPRGEKRIERFIEVDIQVKIFGIGSMVEQLIEKQTRDLYDRAASFTNQWIREKGL
jgi:hypothetical protein